MTPNPDEQHAHRPTLKREQVASASGQGCGPQAVITLLPVLPLALTMFSLQELLGRLLKVIF